MNIESLRSYKRYSLGMKLCFKIHQFFRSERTYVYTCICIYICLKSIPIYVLTKNMKSIHSVLTKNMYICVYMFEKCTLTYNGRIYTYI